MRWAKKLASAAALVGLTMTCTAGVGRAVRLVGQPARFTGAPASWRNLLIGLDVCELQSVERIRLSRYLGEAFDKGLDWNVELNGLTAEERQHAIGNVGELTRSWLLGKVHDYYDRPPSARARYLERELNGLTCWRVPNGNSGRSVQRPMGLSALSDLASTWPEYSDRRSREPIEQFLQAARAQVIARDYFVGLPPWLRVWLPSGQSRNRDESPERSSPRP